MKKFYSLFAAAACAATVSAQVVQVNDSFDYTGALNGNGWVTHSGTSGQIMADGSVAKLVAGASEDVNKAFATPYTIVANSVNVATYSATINVLNPSGLGTAGDYFLGLSSTAGTSVTTYFARLYIKGTATGYTLGILNNSGGTATPAYSSEIAYGTPANIVVTYTVNTAVVPTNVATLLVNAQPLLTNSTGTSAAPTVLASVALRQAGSASNGTGNVSIDNLVVTTASSVLGVSDTNAGKVNLVKNTIVANNLLFTAKADVQIVNMNGQVVKTASVNENTSLDVASLPKGTYVVTGAVNGKTVSQKIIKK